MGLEHPRGGAVAIIQRFGGALNLNVHIHALVLDGVFARHDRGVAFHPAPRLTTLDVAEVLAAVEPAIRRLLDKGELPEGNREGHAEDGGVDRWADEAPALAGLAAASVQGFVALGRHSGIRLHRLGLGATWKNRGHWARVMRGGTVWTCMRGSSSRRGSATGGPVDDGDLAAAPATAPRRARGQRWADLMRRTFGCDALACPRCGGRLRLIALIEEAAVIGRILRHLGLPTDLPIARPARAPPLFAVVGEAQADEYESVP